MLIEEGILTGGGETLDDLADSIVWVRNFKVDQAQVMTFVPQPNTPMVNTASQGEFERTDYYRCYVVDTQSYIHPLIS